MLKRIVILLTTLFSVLFFVSSSWETSSTCSYTEGSINYTGALEGCLNDTSLVNSWSLEASDWFKKFILNLIKIIAGFFALLAVWALVYGALMLTLSAWEDEKIKKAKDIVKWALIWFLAIISSGALITIIIEVFYSVT